MYVGLPPVSGNGDFYWFIFHLSIGLVADTNLSHANAAICALVYQTRANNFYMAWIIILLSIKFNSYEIIQAYTDANGCCWAYTDTM